MGYNNLIFFIIRIKMVINIKESNLYRKADVGQQKMRKIKIEMRELTKMEKAL